MVYLAIKHFRHLVEGRSFFVVTDHKSLTLLSLRGPSSILLARSATSISYHNSPPTFVISQDPQMQQQMHDHVLKVANLPTSTTAIDFAAMARVQQEDLAKSTAPPSLTLRATPPPRTLLCDISHGAPRPYVPQAFRRTVFDALHSLSHPRTGINADARKWARSCVQCQRAKIHQYTITPIGTFATPDARFDHIHIDLIGPLPSYKGHSYLLTCVDRFTRWPEAIPLPVIMAYSCTGFCPWLDQPLWCPIYHHNRSWCSVFESDLLRQLVHLLGSSHIRQQRHTTLLPTASWNASTDSSRLA